MFLKKHIRKKNGKEHLYWSLVESYRTARGPRNRTVAYLGELQDPQRAGWANLCRTLDGKPLPAFEPTLFDPCPEQDEVPENISVRVNGVSVQSTTDFGDVWLGLVLWRTVGLDRLFKEIQPSGREFVDWGMMFAILAVARLCEPSSELHISDTWYPGTALPQILGILPESVHVQRLYRTLDMLHPHKAAIETHLKNRLGELFDIEYDILLYDITSTYFEGEMKRNPQAKRGYSRDKRPDCKQICIGLVVTKEGLPLGYEVFDGNRSDVTTVEDIVDAMESKYGRANRIWVMDRGMVSEDNLEYIRARDGQYIVGANRNELKKYERELLDKNWEQVYEDLEVKKCASPDGEETFVLCRSAARAKKERAMHDRCSQRIEKALDKLSKRLSHAKKRPNRDRVNRQIGRILQRNSHSAGRYDVIVESDPERKGHLIVRWEIHSDWEQWMLLRDGAYILRTNIRNLDGETLWKMYTQLTDVEASFRHLKMDLGIRPVFHHKEDRVQSHILVAFLGYTLFKTLEQWCVRSGLGRSTRTVLEEFARIKCCEVVLPTSGGKSVSLRCVTKPDEYQRTLLQRLRIDIPSRLGRPKWQKIIKT